MHICLSQGLIFILLEDEKIYIACRYASFSVCLPQRTRFLEFGLELGVDSGHPEHG